VETLEKAHGRVEHRKLSVLPVIHGMQGWQDVLQICKIERTRFICVTKKEQKGVFYFMTSLSQTQANPDKLMNLIRKHWSIENHLHWQKDNLLYEDKSTTRTKNGPQNLSLIRSFILFILKKNNLKPKETLENLANKFDKITNLLNKSMGCLPC
jgi:predicted transposase YbfD/YdcC